MNNQLIIAIDLKKERIRIHKKTLHALGEPKYIQLLYNPETKQLVIKCYKKGSASENLFRVALETLRADFSYEICSKELLNLWSETIEDMNTGNTYRIYGEMIDNNNAALFSMDTLQRTDEV